MSDRYSNAHDWFTSIAALAVWAAHFMLLWTASSIFPGQAAARWMALVLTVLAAAALVWLWRRAGKPALLTAAGLALGLAAAGVLFDAMPAVIG